MSIGTCLQVDTNVRWGQQQKCACSQSAGSHRQRAHHVGFEQLSEDGHMAAQPLLVWLGTALGNASAAEHLHQQHPHTRGSHETVCGVHSSYACNVAQSSSALDGVPVASMPSTGPLSAVACKTEDIRPCPQQRQLAADWKLTRGMPFGMYGIARVRAHVRPQWLQVLRVRNAALQMCQRTSNLLADPLGGLRAAARLCRAMWLSTPDRCKHAPERSACPPWRSPARRCSCHFARLADMATADAVFGRSGGCRCTTMFRTKCSLTRLHLYGKFLQQQQQQQQHLHSELTLTGAAIAVVVTNSREASCE